LEWCLPCKGRINVIAAFTYPPFTDEHVNLRKARPRFFSDFLGICGKIASTQTGPYTTREARAAGLAIDESARDVNCLTKEFYQILLKELAIRLGKTGMGTS
jgi:hypothetical protein